MWAELVYTRNGGGARVRGYAVPGLGPARVTDRKVVPVDGPRSCRSQLVVYSLSIYIALPRRHCPAKIQRYRC